MTKGKRAGEKMAKAIIRLTDLMAHFDAEDFYRGLYRIIQAEMRLRMMDVKLQQIINKPTIVCLCGSTRFADHHAIMRWELEKQGAIVLMINYLPAWYADSQGWDGHDHFGEKAGIKEQLDELHLRKIDVADKIMVINVDGYIGESTRREIEYAVAIGKPVEYLIDAAEDDER